MRFALSAVRRLVFAFALAGLSVASCARYLSPTTISAVGAPEYSYWPHEVSDIKPDPGVRFGTLANGMRYALLRNTQPAGTISLRFRIAAGSLQETDAQRGVAHFLEHMAFNGSQNVAEGEFVKLLQRQGLAFGAHTNAYTSTDETVYKLELPKNDVGLIDTGLMLFREIADRLTLSNSAIEREKGVVLAELRKANTPEFRAFEARWKRLYEGQRQAHRLPMGIANTIEQATRDLIVDYYRNYYSPERTLLVAAGDFDPDRLEAQIKTKFSDWKNADSGPPDPAQGPIKKRGLETASWVEPNLAEWSTVSWFQAPEDGEDTAAQRERTAKRQLPLSMINNRFSRIERGANPPFIGASIGRAVERDLANTLTLSVSSRPGGWSTALAAAEQELRRAIAHGFSQNEVDRVVKAWRAGLEDKVAKASTRHSSSLANEITSEFANRGVFSHPSTDRDMFEAYAQTLSATEALASLRELVSGEGPLVFVSAGSPIAGGESAIAMAFERSRATDVSPSSSSRPKDFPYVDYGKAGEVVARTEAADLGISMLRFANGVRLNIKVTEFEDDTIYVGVRFAGGYVHLPRRKPGLNRMLPFGFMEGGLRQMTADELDEALAGKIVSTDLDIDEDVFEFEGRTNARDLSLQLQLMAAYVTDPAYRNAGLDRLKAAAESYLKQFSSSPSRVLAREAPALVRSQDLRWAFPTLAQIRALSMRDVEEVMRPALDHSPIEISIVGDVDVADAIAAVASTFGALKPRAETLSEPMGARSVRFPDSQGSYRFAHEGRDDQAAAYVVWPGPDFPSNPRRARALSLVREIIEVRLIEEFREAQGAAYSPSVASSYSSVFPDFGYLSASVETKPDLIEGFYRTLYEILGDLKAGRFSDDTVARARNPLIESIKTERRSNGYWVDAIEDVQTAPHALGAIRSQISDYLSITKDEIAESVRTYLSDRRRIEIRVFPGARKTGTVETPTTSAGIAGELSPSRRVLYVAMPGAP